MYGCDHQQIDCHLCIRSAMETTEASPMSSPSPSIIRTSTRLALIALKPAVRLPPTNLPLCYRALWGECHRHWAHVRPNYLRINCLRINRLSMHNIQILTTQSCCTMLPARPQQRVRVVHWFISVEPGINWWTDSVLLKHLRRKTATTFELSSAVIST